MALSEAVIDWIERMAGPGAHVTRVAEFPPSATEKHLVELAGPLRLVLRRFHDEGRLGRDPWYVAEHEALALRLLAGSAVPAPRLIALAHAGDVCGTPAILETWLPGTPAWKPVDLDGHLAHAAAVLVAIHAVPLDPGLPRYAPYRKDRLASPARTTRPDLWEEVGAILEGPLPAHRDTFIHRDYHPGNVLTDGVGVTGVVDWATAACGPPGIDLARMRVNLALHHGGAVARSFAEAYVAAGGDAGARDPYWNLLDAADLLLDLPGNDRRDLALLETWAEGIVAEVR